MTKKHFVKFAALLKREMDLATHYGPDEMVKTREAVRFAAATFASVASEDNPKFDRAKFFLACGLSPNGRNF